MLCTWAHCGNSVDPSVRLLASDLTSIQQKRQWGKDYTGLEATAAVRRATDSNDTASGDAALETGAGEAQTSEGDEDNESTSTNQTTDGTGEGNKATSTNSPSSLEDAGTDAEATPFTFVFSAFIMLAFLYVSCHGIAFLFIFCSLSLFTDML